MLTVLLFSRLELTHLYGSLSSFLEKNFNVIHLAYSRKEQEILREVYGLDNIIVMEDELEILRQNTSRIPVQIKRIDEEIIRNTGGRFSLNSAIQSDRTLAYENYDTCLQLAEIYYYFWDKLISETKCDYMLHEPNAILMTQMASIISKNYNVLYLSPIQTYGLDNFNWRFVDASTGNCIELNTDYLRQNEGPLSNFETVQEFIKGFRYNFDLLLPLINSKLNSKWASNNFFLIFVKRVFKHVLCKFSPNRRQTEGGKIIDHIELFLDRHKKSFWEQLHHDWSHWHKVEYDKFEDDKNFYFYPLHLEPEAVVLYWADGIYKNQVKLIENIAGQLPPDCYLYVKDHPVGGKYRDYIDYKRIREIPNVKLLEPGITGKHIVLKSKGVITINGTAGFEALLLNKQVYTFGQSFYNICSRVKYIENVKDLRDQIYSQYNVEYTDDDDIYSFVSAYLSSSHRGFIAFFADYARKSNIELKANAETVSKEIVLAISKLENYRIRIL